MGYPMTWQRIVNRNRLAEADYGDKASGFNTEIHTLRADQFNDGVNFEEVLHDTLKMACKSIEEANSRWSLLVGDLRRLGTDTVDEKAICGHIAAKLELDQEVVAAVLKEFFQW